MTYPERVDFDEQCEYDEAYSEYLDVMEDYADYAREELDN